MIPVPGILRNTGCFVLDLFFFVVLVCLNWDCSDNNLQKVRKST